MMPSGYVISVVFDAFILAGLVDWLARRNATENADDELVAGAHEYLLNAIGDADRLAKIAEATGIDLRQQLTVSQVQALEEEARLRRMGHSRN